LRPSILGNRDNASLRGASAAGAAPRSRGSGLNRERLRTTFEQVAELYDRARPGYPPQVFDDLVSLAQLHAGARVLEIGCGTGKATRDLVARGLDVTCVELGDDLAAVARRNVPEAEIVTANFETWEPERAEFDAVVAFTAFHWVDPGLRYEKCARLGRALAVVGTHHVSPEGSDPFFAEVQEDYGAVRPEEERDPPGPPDTVEGLRAEIEASGAFAHVAERRYVWEQEYDAQSYVDVLDTYSGHRALDEPRRNELYERIRRRIEARPGGVVRKTYLATLDVATRRSGASR